MENKKRLIKSTSIVFVALLMLFSIVLFTACKPNDPPVITYTKENAITVLNNATNMQSLPTGQIEVKSTGMTEYKGIDGWELNSIDFKEVELNLNQIMPLLLKIYLTDINEMDINQDFLRLTSSYHYEGDRYLKYVMSENKLIIITYDNTDAIRYLINFNDDFSIHSIISESRYDVQIMANGKAYEIESLSSKPFYSEYKQSLDNEKTKPVKNDNAIDVNYICNNLN